MSLLVGLTGGMGSGKSLAASYFKALGAQIIDADRISRELVAPGKPAWKEIIEEFGSNVLNPDQTLNRKQIAAIVFNDESKRKKLEDIIHPRVIVEERRLYEKYRQKNSRVLAVIDAALLIESGNYKNVDKVVVVQCGKEEQIRRVMERDGTARSEVENRLHSQMPLEEKVVFGDYILRNDDTRESLKSQVGELYRNLRDQV
ncbi:MAG: dephospho-CoA kinase [Nitrospinaceae bacterium]|nr:dephospho-CoA kinase [Nitrospinaceae bacterium]